MEPFKMDPSCPACQQCQVKNKEVSCEYRCPKCGKIVSQCYVIDGVCFTCKLKGKD